MKPFFVDSRGISSTRFGTLLSAPSLPNLVMPIFSGLFVDNQGHERGALLFTVVALLGHTAFVFFLTLTPALSTPGSYVGALTARVVYGIGESGAGVV